MIKLLKAHLWSLAESHPKGRESLLEMYSDDIAELLGTSKHGAKSQKISIWGKQNTCLKNSKNRVR